MLVMNWSKKTSFVFFWILQVIDFDKPYEIQKDVSKTFRYHPAAVVSQPNYQEKKVLP
jgi:hypothetical protein